MSDAADKEQNGTEETKHKGINLRRWVIVIAVGFLLLSFFGGKLRKYLQKGSAADRERCEKYISQYYGLEKSDFDVEIKSATRDRIEFSFSVKGEYKWYSSEIKDDKLYSEYIGEALTEKADARVKETMSEFLSGLEGTVRRCGCDIYMFMLLYLPQKNYESLFTRSKESEDTWESIYNYFYIEVVQGDADTIGKGYFTALRDELFFLDSIRVRYYNSESDSLAYKELEYRPKDDSLQITERLQESEN
ncbi:MAG: hypothetical protein IKZ69_06105 [Lachnospiraceae bacterium]|nr:hypothetical protein [Lachnospiraceae bacterium]MBR4813461.1 hypothetical protein [Lachnospiraceae bacterium]